MSSTLSNIAGRLASLEIWVLAALVAGTMVTERLLPYAAAAAFFFLFVRWLANGHLTLRTPLDTALVLLLVMLPVTLWATALPDVTVPQVYRLLIGIAFFYAIVNWAITADRLRWGVLGSVLAGMLLAFGAVFSVQWAAGKLPLIPGDLYQRFTLLVADTVHPNVMAGNLVILLPVPLAGLLFAWRNLNKSWRVLLLIVVLTMIPILVLTLARGAWLAFGVASLLLVTLRWRRGWIVLPLGGIAAGVTVYLVGLKPILDALSSGTTVSGLDGGA